MTIEVKTKIFVVSGPSGAGKNSVTSPLRNMKDRVAFSVSYTTRKNMRPGEVDGLDYRFVSDGEFDRMINSNEMLEWEQIYENRYGTRRSDFESLIESGKAVVALLDVKGAATIKKYYDNVVTIFILPPTSEEAAKRLESRGTEDGSSQLLRKERYELELNRQADYDYTIVNSDLKEAQKRLLEIVNKEIAQAVD